LDTRDLYIICSNFWEARIEWFNIGLALNLKVGDLEAIRQINRDNVDDCFRDMLKKWLRTNPRPLQSNLITVLREKAVGFNQLAEDLEDKSLKRDRVKNRLRMASTTKTSSAPRRLEHIEGMNSSAEEKKNFTNKNEYTFKLVKFSLLCYSIYTILINFSDPLDTRDLYIICSNFWEARIKWFNIGLALNLEVGDLEAIRQTNRDNVDDCFMDMLKKWLRTSRRPTQSKLITVLRERTIGFNQLAEELESKSLKRDRVINQLRMASTRYTKKTTPSLVKYKSVIIIIGAPILLILLFTALSLARTYYNNLISPKDCFATGSGLEVAVAGERANAVLHLVSHGGEAHTKQVIVKTCEVMHEITGKILDCEIIWRANHKVKETNVGWYEVSYQATSQGRHQLHIKVEGEHIKGSPFTVTVIMLVIPIKTISGVTRPSGVAVNQRGEIIVAERYGHCISIFSPRGEKLRCFRSKGSKPGQFKEPRGVTVDDDGNILVADSGNDRIQKFTSDNKHNITSVGSRGSNRLQFFLPVGVAISPITKNIAILEFRNRRVQILNPDLTFNSSIGDDYHGQFSLPLDIAFDSTGNMYVADTGNKRDIQVFIPEGKHKYIYLRQFRKAGKDDAGLGTPSGIHIDSDNIMYITEGVNHRISLFTLEGKFLMSLGIEGDGPGRFNYPCGITVDKQGIVYVADYYNNRIQIFAKLTKSQH
jgi:tripartite motif-containing protein 2/3/tripartite motif-containing protein 71